MDYKKFVQVRKAIQRPLGYDLYYMGDKLARARMDSMFCISGLWYIEAWFPGNPESRYIDIEMITYKRRPNAATR